MSDVCPSCAACMLLSLHAFNAAAAPCCASALRKFVSPLQIVWIGLGFSPQRRSHQAHLHARQLLVHPWISGLFACVVALFMAVQLYLISATGCMVGAPCMCISASNLGQGSMVLMLQLWLDWVT